MERKISDLMALRDELGQMLRSCESDKIGECKVIGCLGHHSVVQDLNGCPLVDHPWKEWNGRNGGAKRTRWDTQMPNCRVSAAGTDEPTAGPKPYNAIPLEAELD